MVETSLNMFDLIVACVIGLSALLSFFRGFIREILSLGAWAGAAVITLYAFPHVAEWVQPKVNNTMVASGLAAMGTFMGSLIIISIVNGILLKYVKTGSDVGVFDNVLGLGFGVARGALLVSIAYFIMSVVIREEDYPEWVKTAVSKPYVEDAAKWVATIAPNYLDDISPLKPEDGDESLEEKLEKDEEKPAIIRQIEVEKESSGPDTRWQSLEELRKNMGVE
ncbi:MAG: hypothetical protein DI582_04710 [Azospirillum brasilense]|nr:MAG: hypothetical protein DI582_04710 [Azospirillum brasilense]